MRYRQTAVFFTLLLVSAASAPAAAPAPDYGRAASILRKYCVGCHNADAPEADLALDSYAGVQTGGGRGVAILPGQSASSRLIRVLTGKTEPKMPPEGEAAPTPEEIAVLAAWIDGGAKGPDGAEPDYRKMLRVPEIEPAPGVREPITAAAYSPDGKLLAVARFGEVELRSPDGRRLLRTLKGHPGKVNAVAFTRDGKYLVAASGVTRLYGEARVWSVADGRLARTIEGHRDALYAALPSPDGKYLATASYDQRIILWDFNTGERIRDFTGHNDAIYDLAFSPDGRVLASASGDETVKLWSVATGQRLDTLSQPEAEQYTVAFSPDGRYVVAGGQDNRIRVWRWVSKDEPRINPLLFARFAHEGAIVQLGFAQDGRTLISVADDRTIKLFETETFTQVGHYEPQPDAAPALAVAPSGDAFVVGRMDGSLERYAVQRRVKNKVAEVARLPAESRTPGSLATSATALKKLPAEVKDAIHAAKGEATAADLYRFRAKAGQKLILEIDAARSGSPLDSKVEVLDAGGEPILRVLLQAARDSYFTFRGKNSTQTNDFRVHNWEEMDLNEYLYARGEVVRLYRFPRGPDSGFDVYGHGKRETYFDTTAVAHALNEPCYIVRPRAPGEPFAANGLPVFPVYSENDDASNQSLGKDSRLHFTAPADGEYLIRVSDARGFEGKNFKYTLTVRPPRPDFSVRLDGANPTVNAGSGKEFKVTAARRDGFEGPIRVDIEGVPPGFRVATPLVIEAGQDEAWGTIHALPNAPKPTPENAKATRVTATATVAGKEIVKNVNNLGEIKLAGKPKLLCSLAPANGERQPPDGKPPEPPGQVELVIEPGQTIAATLRIERNGNDGRVSFEAFDVNLPFGVYIDNVGLNGVLIPEGQNERTVYITAVDWVEETSRSLHLKTKSAGGQTTRPVVLRVRRSK